jgi:hypothetical protein
MLSFTIPQYAFSFPSFSMRFCDEAIASHNGDGEDRRHDDREEQKAAQLFAPARRHLSVLRLSRLDDRGAACAGPACRDTFFGHLPP